MIPTESLLHNISVMSAMASFSELRLDIVHVAYVPISETKGPANRGGLTANSDGVPQFGQSVQRDRH